VVAARLRWGMRFCEVRQAHGKEIRLTQLGRAMRASVRDNPLAAAPCEIGVNSGDSLWVVTLYVPHTCADAAAGVAAPNATPAAAATDSSVCPELTSSAMMPGDLLEDPESMASPAAAMQMTPVTGVGPGSGRHALGSGLTAAQDSAPADRQTGCEVMNEPRTGSAFARVRTPFLKLALPACSFSLG
jgi:hypothetical protein